MPNDFTFLGWLTTGMYAATTLLCGFAAQARCREAALRADASKPARRVAMFWLMLGMGLLLLACNKQLDLQTHIIDRLRHMAERDAWYGHRRALQAASVVAAGLAAIGAMWGVIRLLGASWRRHRLALLGLLIMAAYLMLRISDIQRMGDVTGVALGLESVRWGLEWLGLSLVAIASWREALRA